ncbi:MAG: carbohydrate kinase family protein [Defluviitaleaceae bacterium]|nr:carbohydrate kinase family protein [Defluviitaleaceae bacterium]
MPYVSIIGAAILDIIAKSNATLIVNDSNPGTISQSAGGVGRNIAENLARLDVDVKLIAAIGTDPAGKYLLDECTQMGIDMQYCQVKEGGVSSTYIAMLDNYGEMAMAIVDYATPLSLEHVSKNFSVINNSEIIVMESNLSEHEISAILDMFPAQDIFVDAISVTKAQRLKNVLSRFHTIKMNRLEAECLADMAINCDGSLEKAGAYFLAQGIKRIVISLGAEGIFYKTKTEQLWHKPAPIVPINATGAGDALMAGLIYCTLHKKDANYTLQFSQAMAQAALQSERAVNPKISQRSIKNGIFKHE